MSQPPGGPPPPQGLPPQGYGDPAQAPQYHGQPPQQPYGAAPPPPAGYYAPPAGAQQQQQQQQPPPPQGYYAPPPGMYQPQPGYGAPAPAPQYYAQPPAQYGAYSTQQPQAAEGQQVPAGYGYQATQGGGYYAPPLGASQPAYGTAAPASQHYGQAPAAYGAYNAMAPPPQAAAVQQATMQPPQSAVPSGGGPLNKNVRPSKVQLFVRCNDLKSKIGRGTPSPYVNVSIRFGHETAFHHTGQTESLKDNLNPEWSKRTELDFYFGELQYLVVDVCDSDAKGQKLGTFKTTLGDLMGAPNCSVTDFLSDGSGAKITLKVEPVAANDHFVFVSFAGSQIKSMDGPLSKSDPFLKIYAMDPQPRLVAKTEFVKNTKDPVWQPMQISLTQLCQGDVNRPIQISCYDYDEGSAEDLIGKFECSVAQLMRPTGFEMELDPPKRSRKSVGKVTTMGPAVIKLKESFEALLYRNLEISLITCVDWTASNLAPSNPQSLHFLSADPNHKNVYEQALETVGSILLAYDRDKYVPMYGFGGKLPGASGVSHCFPLNGNPQDPRVVGVPGMLQAYRAALQNVSLHGPTQFGEIISESIKQATSDSNAFRYTVLLILTDGAIHDMPAVKRLIASACKTTPLSIVIAGVGSADFSGMEELDGDHSRKTFPRDIVQFVPMRKHSGPHSIQQLASDVLAEIPAQCSDYFFLRQ
ncbi:Copine-8 [Porphyridium purpureum]|uniref:Copine-8 n=1 Tax=Porphyridium purpureum TaxID=35688 RepID=A0A5J4Z3L7_PORPP|nr:Copine-8 [Porphyridium purpureum]|eukprot:POR2403..scf295_1